jgi:hypothetical protein
VRELRQTVNPRPTVKVRFDEQASDIEAVLEPHSDFEVYVAMWSAAAKFSEATHRPTCGE